MKPSSRYPLHLVIASLAALGAGLGLLDDPGGPRTAFWFLCLAAALYNAVLFGVGWQLHREDATGTP